MKTIKLFTLLVVLLLFSSVPSIAKRWEFLNSAVVPAAQGYVQIRVDSNKNYEIKIRITNLAASDRLQPARNSYVVWLETDDDQIKNLGQLKTYSPFLSSKLKAGIEAISSFKPKKIFITAEDDPRAEQPGSEIILTTPYFEGL